MSILSRIDDNISNHSVIDCRRLGKFDSNKTPHPRRARPLEVQSVLSHNCASSIIIKPDQTNQERAIQKLLLKERWALIEAGFGKKDIKIHRSTVLLNGKVHARVVNNTLQEEPMDKSELSRDISLALFSPTVSEGTHLTTSTTEVDHQILPPPPHPIFKPYLLADSISHNVNTQSLALHANHYHAGTATAANGSVVALPTN